MGRYDHTPEFVHTAACIVSNARLQPRQPHGASARHTGVATSFVGFIPLFCGVPVSSTCVATHSVIPIARKHFQLPSGSFLSTASTVPRTCFGSPPGDATYEAVK
jgi:hypothetical protein